MRVRVSNKEFYHIKKSKPRQKPLNMECLSGFILSACGFSIMLFLFHSNSHCIVSAHTHPNSGLSLGLVLFWGGFRLILIYLIDIQTSVLCIAYI